jgi:hypothetical protein
MKIQDLGFFLLFCLVLWRRNQRLSIIIGLMSLFLAMPLFKFWIFFTAERLTWYAAAFFALAIFLAMFRLTKKNENRH